MTRVSLSSFLLLGLLAVAGCGDHRLTALGTVQLTTPTATITISLPTDTRLDTQAAAGRITGSCTVSRTPTATGVRYGAVVDLFTNESTGLRSLTVMQSTDAGSAGSIAAQTSAGTLSSGAGCGLVLTEATDGGDVILDAPATCALASADGSQTATILVHLELHGCTVTQ